MNHPTADEKLKAVAPPTREQRLYDALKRISSYQPPDKLRRSSQKQYGLEADEAIEYAYENVIWEAQRAIKGMRRPR